MKPIPIRTIFRDPQSHAGRTVMVAGWVRAIRASNAFGFIELSDGSIFSTLQIVFEEGALDNFGEIARQNVGAALRVTGTVVLTPGAPQPLELKAGHIEIEGKSTPDYPIQKKRHSFEFLRTLAHLRPRTNTFGAVFRVRSAAACAIHRFFSERGFLYVHTPIITSSDCEGAGEMFRVTTLDLDDVPRLVDGSVDYSADFFGRRVGLTVSGQLNAEAFALAFSKVYTFGPTFRAEKSNTARHAAEFWMIEPEMAFADLEDDMRLAEEMLKSVVSDVMRECPEDLAFFDRFVEPGLLERLEHLVTSDFARVTYTEAVRLLETSGQAFAYPVRWGADLQTEHERYLTEKIFKKPVFVTDYPRDIKAFYMRQNDDQRTVAAMDLLVPGVGELVGGSQREERPDVLQGSMRRQGLDPEAYRWYLDLRRFGGARHAGFGLGFERLVMYITGMQNIRDVAAFPRTFGSAEY